MHTHESEYQVVNGLDTPWTVLECLGHPTFLYSLGTLKSLVYVAQLCYTTWNDSLQFCDYNYIIINCALVLLKITSLLKVLFHGQSSTGQGVTETATATDNFCEPAFNNNYPYAVILRIQYTLLLESTSTEDLKFVQSQMQCC